MEIIIKIYCTFLLFSYSLIAANYVKPGPKYQATIGQEWPKSEWRDDKKNFFQVNPDTFKFMVVNKNCDIINNAIERYTKIIKNAAAKSLIRAPQTKTIKNINTIYVNLTKKCEIWPYLDMDESYFVFGDGRVVANSVWGILRGLETLSQILVPMPNGMMRIPDTEIYDVPRFSHRGIMLDTSRHFIEIDKIYELLEGMAYNKFNVFHWHMVDDQSFPFNSSTFPELATKGAYFPSMIYTVQNVANIIEFARLRGIRVIPEFDTPGHTASWALSHPEIMTQCGEPYEGQIGPINPTKETTFNFLYKLFKEITGLFKDKYIHLGGDEVASGCWESNSQILDYLNEINKDTDDLSSIYFERFSANISGMGKIPLFWQEALINNYGVRVPSQTIAQIWFDQQNTLAELTQQGYRVIVNEGWFLYVLDTGGDWEKFYEVEPTDFDGTAKQKSLVIGGEGCLWSEFINSNNIIPMTFPRASAIAERLWTHKNIRDIEDAKLRLEEHACRLNLRGIHAQPANDYGFC